MVVAELTLTSVLYRRLLQMLPQTLCLCQHREMPLRLLIKHSTFHIEH